MRFRVGRYYRHEGGRAIAVVGEVKTWKWGPMLVIEETDHTGHAISVVEKVSAEDEHQRWVEIGQEEWRNALGIVEA